MSIPIASKVALCYIRQVSPTVGKLSRNIIREICAYFGSAPMLPLLSDAVLVLLDTATQRCLTVELAVQFSSLTQYCLVNTFLLCIEGNSGRTGEIDLLTHKFILRMPVLTPRCCTGLVHYTDHVYVFGGLSGQKPTSRSERYHLSTKEWTSLPKLGNRKCAFSPLVYQEEIYIPQLRIAGNYFEVFSPASLFYRTVNFGKVTFDQQTVFLYNSEILLFTGSMWRRVSMNAPYVARCCITPLIVAGKYVYWTTSMRKFVRFDIQTRETVQSDYRSNSMFP